MATYRLKSKLYGEFDGNEKKDKGFLGTGLSTGQVMLGTAAALTGRNIYRSGVLKGKWGSPDQQKRLLEQRIAKKGITDRKVQTALKNRATVQNAGYKVDLGDYTRQQQFNLDKATAAAKQQTQLSNLQHGVDQVAVQNAQSLNKLAGFNKKQSAENITQALNNSRLNFQQL